MKETIAHLTVWWRWEVSRLAAAQRRRTPAAHPAQSDVPLLNHWTSVTNRDRSLNDVLHDAQAAWHQYEAIVQALPETELFEPGRFAWLQGQALGPATWEGFIGHLHDEHEPMIRTWLAQLRA